MESGGIGARRSGRGSRATVVVVVVVVAIVVVVGVVVVSAPANWLARFVAERTGGVVLLADADGTVWSGSAVVALAAPDADAAAPTSRDEVSRLDRLALPGRVTWTLRWAGGLAPVLHLTHDGVLLRPLDARYVDGGIALDADAAALPASLLRLAGAPLNSLLPEGRCELRWNGLRLDRRGPPVGDGTLRIAGLALAISPVRPLGDYLVTWSSGPAGLTWQVATERGPLEVEGNGSVVAGRAQTRAVVRIAADAPAAVAAQLGVLLDLIGRRGPNEAVIEGRTS